MSSIVKKASHFIPKLKKKPLRKKTDTNLPTPLTPPVTQVSSEENGKDQDKLSQEVTQGGPTKNEQLPTQPDAPNFKYSLQSKKPSEASQPSQRVEEDIDPKDTSRQVSQSVIQESENDSEQKSDEEDEYGDNDIFKEPDSSLKYRRQSSIIAQRRLSGITPSIRRRKSSSVSLTPTNGTHSETHGSEMSAPMRIGIPVSKPTKRRRSSANIRPPHKKASLVLKASIISTPNESMAKIQTETDSDKAGESDNAKVTSYVTSDSKFVIGIDPRTNKLRKFRLLGENETKTEDVFEDGRKIPIAPEDLDTNITSAKQLPKKIKDEDISLYAQVGVNIEEITMADLCKPTLPIGEVSDNFSLVKAAQSKIKKQKEQRKQDRILACQQRIALEKAASQNGNDETNQPKKQKNNLLNIDDDDQYTRHSTLKLTMKADGSIGYDEDSTIVSRHGKHGSSNKSREESNPFENPITSSTYSKRKHTDRWTSEELKQFYEALSTWGTDFTFIAQLFPYRTRKQIKAKFNLEEKKYPEIIEMALKRKLPADFEKYCKDSKNKIETLEYYNEELKQVRIKHEEHLALIAEERERAIKEDAEASRKREIEIRTGSKPMSRAEKLQELRKNEMVLGSIEEVKKQRHEIEKM